MKWVTRDYVHLDRVACPWLIKRFIDKEAEFVFVPWGEESKRPADAIPFALPGAELGPHDEQAHEPVPAAVGQDRPAADQLVAMPPDVSFADAASLPVAYGTAHRMLITHKTVKAGDRVRITETRPLSKLKHWRLTEILERAR